MILTSPRNSWEAPRVVLVIAAIRGRSPSSSAGIPSAVAIVASTAEGP